ncbi:MAG: hypothetical protein ABW200_07945 [Hyphomicrobiaceae bacterium]
MRLLEAVTATRWLATSARGLDRGIGLAILRNRVGTDVGGLALAISTVAPVTAICPVTAISTVISLIGAVTIAEPVLVLVAPEGAIAVGVVA